MIIPTREELKKVYDAGPDAVIDHLLFLYRKIAELSEKIVNLEGKINKNSSNSSKPPSSDGLKKKPPKNTRKKSRKKSGGQKGHEGHTLQMSQNPDIIEILSVNNCKNCGCSFRGKDIRQEFGIVIKIVVTEFRAEIRSCSCGVTTTADFPNHVTKKVQYGNSMRAFLVYLNKYQHTPLERTVEFIYDTTGHVISEGTVQNTVKSCYEKLEPWESHVKNLLIESLIVGFDETGVRCLKKLMWIHTACTAKLTLLFLHEKRGKKAMDAFGILPYFKGTAIHDYFKAYYNYYCQHSSCIPHIQRELSYLYEEENRKWAGKLDRLFIKMHKKVEKAKEKGRNSLTPMTLEKLEYEYDDLLKKASRATPTSKVRTNNRGRIKQSKARNLLNRLLERKEEVLRFLFDFRIWFSNNYSERSFRMAKVQQKISGCHRSFEGGQIYTRIRSYIDTCKKNNMPVLDSIARVFTGNPFIPSGS